MTLDQSFNYSKGLSEPAWKKKKKREHSLCSLLGPEPDGRQLALTNPGERVVISGCWEVGELQRKAGY